MFYVIAAVLVMLIGGGNSMNNAVKSGKMTNPIERKVDQHNNANHHLMEDVKGCKAK